MTEDKWTRLEVEAVVSDYFDMLLKERKGLAFNKAEHNRGLREIVRRSRGSIERKHQNISAILLELGFAYIEGYKPLANYQSLLQEVVAERLLSEHGLIEIVENEVVAKVEGPPLIDDLLTIRVPVPKMDKEKTRTSRRALPLNKSIPQGSMPPRNYLEMEARNSSLGLAGEELVLEFECERLRRAGQKHLAGRVQHISKNKGDYFGYDVLSFEVNGKERFIEVKTTQYGPSTPFFASRNEVEVSEFLEKQYHLYRLFDFKRNPRFYTLSGSLRKSSQLSAVQYSAIPR